VAKTKLSAVTFFSTPFLFTVFTVCESKKLAYSFK
jgi:hypothetical protein